MRKGKRRDEGRKEKGRGEIREGIGEGKRRDEGRKEKG